jgi:hypothetical protein
LIGWPSVASACEMPSSRALSRPTTSITGVRSSGARWRQDRRLRRPRF